MIISDSKKFIFLHNPKVAGTSLRRILIKHYDTRNNFYWGVCEAERLNRKIDKAHMSITDFRLAFPADYELLDEYFVFVFVRHPVERFISSISEHIRHYQKNIDLSALAPGQIQNMISDVAGQIDMYKIRYNIQFRHFMPQHEIIFEGFKCRADFIGHLNTLQSDFSRVCEILDLDNEQTIKTWNRKSRQFSGNGDDIDKKIRDKIYFLYEKDFIYFNFK